MLTQFRLLGSKSTTKFEIMAISVGPWGKLSPNGREIYTTEKSLRPIVPLFDGLEVYEWEMNPGTNDHLPTLVRAAMKATGTKILNNKRGVLSTPRFGAASDGKLGIIAEFDATNEDTARKFLEFLSGQAKETDGFSIDGETKWNMEIIDGKAYDVPIVSALDSLDIVKYPAADGKVLRLAASRNIKEGTDMNLTAKQKAILTALLHAAGVKPEAVEKIFADGADFGKESITAIKAVLKDEQLKTLNEIAAKIEKGEEVDAQFTALDKLREELMKPATDPNKTAEAETAAKAKAEAEAKAKVEAEAKAKADAEKNKVTADDPAVKQANEILAKATEQLEAAQRVNGEAVIEKVITASHLPDASKVAITERLKASKTYDPKKIGEALDSEAKYLKAVLGDKLVPGLRITGSIEAGQDETDLMLLGIQGMLAGKDLKDANKKAVPAFRSFREMNSRITGSRYDEPLDRVFRKLSRGLTGGIGMEASDIMDIKTGRITASTFVTSDLASMYLVAMHKQFISDYATPSQYDYWRQLVRVVSFKDLYAHTFSRMGWYAAAPAISEGGTYQEVTTAPTDENISMTAVKYGHIFCITDVMIINDDLGAVQRLQRQLSDGMKRDIHNDAMGVILNNTAVAYGADTDTLIHANHANGAASGGASLLTADTVTLEAAWAAMVAQTEFGTGAVLGDLNKPRYLLCHALGYARALKITQGERAIQTATTTGEFGAGDFLGDSGAINTQTTKGIIPVIALSATVTTDWWTLADPNSTPAPAVMVGFLNGQEEPEVVTEPAQTGSNFTADKIRIKIKNWRDVEPGDHRGIYGQIA